MKQFILVLLSVLTFSTSQAGWWWDGHSDKDQQRINELENQNRQQQQQTGNWQIISVILSVSCIGALVAGAAIGSKGRRDAHGNQ